MAARKDLVRVAAVGDIHVSRTAQPRLQTLFSQVAERADVLVLCGDLCDYGLPEEAHLLAREISNLKIPIVGVLGNHDFESGQTAEVIKILCDAGLQILDGDAVEIEGIGFAGVKGFAGGFGRGALGPWGEEIIKSFVREAVNEALKLESALARLRTEQKIAVLHYAPIQGTVEGEPVEIFPFLGSSRLEDPLLRYPVQYVLHGHAHRGTPEGRTTNGIPVYNVAMPLMIETFPDQPPFRLLEIPMTQPALAASH
ncbi:MAG: Metallophosphoesterase [Chloroflexi bacterium]|jgi:Icc-related predicted phosphoesterase|nr:Metallophosphoesterase [Chloroflexota bacterium]